MKIQGENFIVYYEPKTLSDKNRAVIIVSVKVSKKAVVRNRIKRQVREIIRNYKKSIFSATGLRIIVLPRALDSKFDEMKQDLEDIFKKIL